MQRECIEHLSVRKILLDSNCICKYDIFIVEEDVIAMKRRKYVHEGSYVAEVEIELLEDEK